MSAVAGDDVVNAAESAAGVTVSGTTTGADSSTDVDFTLTNGSNTITKSDNTVASNAWSASVTAANLTTLTDGTITISATATDAAGNTSTTATRTITRETVLPTISSASYNGSTITLTLSEGVAVSGTKTGGDFTVSVSGASDPTVSSYTISNSTVTLTLGLAIASGSTVTLAYAKNATAANRIKDTAGNELAAVSSQSVVGKAVSVSAVSGGYVNASEGVGGLSILGSSVNIAAGTALSVVFDGAGMDVTKSATIGADGSWSVSLFSGEFAGLDAATPNSAGETITVTATAAGISGTQTFIYDPARPTIAIGAVATDNIVNAAEGSGGVTISGTTVGADSGSAVDLVFTRGSNTVSIADLTVSSNAWTTTLSSANLTTLGEGTISISATVDDTAGNTGTAARTVVYDATAPTAGVTDAPSGSTNAVALRAVVGGSAVTHYKHKVVVGTACVGQVGMGRKPLLRHGLPTAFPH